MTAIQVANQEEEQKDADRKTRKPRQKARRRKERQKAHQRAHQKQEHERKARPPSVLPAMSPSLEGKRVLPTKMAAAFCGVSLRNFERDRARGLTPPPVRRGLQALGYTVESLIAYNAARTQSDRSELDLCVDSVRRVAAAVDAGKLDRHAVVERLKREATEAGLVEQTAA